MDEIRIPEHANRPGEGLRVEVLHQFRVVTHGQAVSVSQGAERLTAFLALADRPHGRHVVAGTLWPDRRDSESAAALRRALWRLNCAVPGVVDKNGSRISLGRDVDVDVHEVRRLAETVTQGLMHVSYQVVRLLEGDLLPDWSFDWLDGYRESLRQMRLHTLEALARNDLDAGRPSGALVAAMAAAAVDPLRESAQRIIVAAHLAEGNVAEALRQFWQYRDLLWAELRLQPTRQMQTMLPEVASQVPARHDRRLSSAG